MTSSTTTYSMTVKEIGSLYKISLFWAITIVAGLSLVTVWHNVLVILSVVMLIAVMLSAVMLSAVMLSAVMVCAIMLSAVMLSLCMLFSLC
jgi:hypothetical protein